MEYCNQSNIRTIEGTPDVLLLDLVFVLQMNILIMLSLRSHMKLDLDPIGAAVR